jgi:hypothetical protein
MANYVAGHVTDPDALDSCIGVEFEAGSNQILVYINEEEIGLTSEQAYQLHSQLMRAIAAYAWHNATWLYASERGSTRNHLMRKDGHDRGGKTLCGRTPGDFAKIIGGWHVEPVRGEVSREQFQFVSSTCRTCLKRYDTLMAAEQEAK